MTNPPVIAIDCRMVNASGIGSCIKGWLPQVIGSNPQWQFQLLGSPGELAGFPWAQLPNVTVRRFEAPIYSLAEQWGWLRMKFGRVDLLWIPHMNIPLFWSGKLLVTIHDVIFLAMPQFFGPAKRAYARLFFWRIRNRADGVFFVSNFSRDEFARVAGAPKGVSEVIYNGIDEKWFEPLREAALPAGIGGRPHIVCVGNVKPHKNLRRLIEAFGLILNDIPHRLVIIGKKEGFITSDSEVEKLAEALGDRIIFTGYVTDDALRAIVAKASALVHPSLYEGFGLPPLEAMALGCPVAVSNAAAMPEICGDAAAYFSPLSTDEIAQAITRLVTSPALARELIDKGSQRVKSFTWEQMSSSLGKFLQRLVDVRA